jgi:hypothetical protein
MPRRELLTPDERETLLAIPQEESERIRHYTLSRADLGFKASAASIPQARTARKYFETAPTDNPKARPSARTLKLLDCSPTSCFNLDMEILSFGIDCAPGGKKSPGYAVCFAINLQSPTPLSTIVNTSPRS